MSSSVFRNRRHRLPTSVYRVLIAVEKRLLDFAVGFFRLKQVYKVQPNMFSSGEVTRQHPLLREPEQFTETGMAQCRVVLCHPRALPDQPFLALEVSRMFAGIPKHALPPYDQIHIGGPGRVDPANERHTQQQTNQDR